eukprot:3849883-Pyramimonas_sp.AAC.1
MEEWEEQEADDGEQNGDDDAADDDDDDDGDNDDDGLDRILLTLVLFNLGCVLERSDDGRVFLGSDGGR